MTTPLPALRRVVTFHDDNARATIFSDSAIASQVQPHGVATSILWATNSAPADVASPTDKARGDIDFVPNGSVVRIVDLPPRSNGGLHRTISLDYIIVLHGTVVLTLDDGMRTSVETGELVVQQATMHSWSNEGHEWARLLCVMLPAEAPVVGGKTLSADLAGIS